MIADKKFVLPDAPNIARNCPGLTVPLTLSI